MRGSSNETGRQVEHPDMTRFRQIRALSDFWSRPQRASRSYYWYLRFEDSRQLADLARRCQAGIGFPHYDPIPLADLHVTLDRIADDGAASQTYLLDVVAAARRVCAAIPAFSVSIGHLNGTASAVGFSVEPAPLIRNLRNELRKATLAAYPQAAIKDSQAHPHVAIAYCNSDDVPAAETISAVEKLHCLPSASAEVCDVALVRLDRLDRAYSWLVEERIPLAGRN